MKLLSIIALAFFPIGVFAQAGASLYFTPIAASAPTGQELSVRVMLNTVGQSVNAADGRVVFDPKELAVERIETDGSIFGSWSTAPRYDNTVGEVVFGGNLPATTTYAGERGEILRVVFRGLRSGETRLRFDTASAILAGDGTGGNILAETKVGVYAFAPTESIPPEPSQEQTEQGEVLGAQTQVIVSATHPEEGAWSRVTDGAFSWVNAPSVVRVLTGLSSDASGRGVRGFIPPITDRSIPDLSEGISYFVVTQEFADGTERTMRYRLAIDTTPPVAPNVRLDDAQDKTNPSVRFFLSATDSLSGVEHVEFSLDGAPADIQKDFSGGEYALSGVAFGGHRLSVAVVDRAGNTREESIEFTIEPLPSPTFILRESELKEGNMIYATGKALPGATLRVYLTPEGGETSVESVTVGPDGIYVFTGGFGLSPGTYRVSADIVDGRGATSDRIAEESVVVRTSVMGMIRRHPMVVAAALAALLCLAAFAFGIRWFMRGRRGDNEDTSVAPSVSARVLVGAQHPRVPNGPVHMERESMHLKEMTRRSRQKDIEHRGVQPHPVMDQGVIDLRPMG